MNPARYGAAIRTGFNKSKYECIYAVDGDGEFGIALNDLPRILKKYAYNDLVITYRYKKRYKTTRIIISWAYNSPRGFFAPFKARSNM